jgi:hypothetical protein
LGATDVRLLRIGVDTTIRGAAVAGAPIEALREGRLRDARRDAAVDP